VVNAYEALCAEGFVRGAIGSGTRVFPTDPLPVSDPDGNPLYLHR